MQPDEALRLIDQGQPIALELEGGAVWRLIADLVQLPDGQWVYADPGWCFNDSGHPLHILPEDAEFVVVEAWDPLTDDWERWQEEVRVEGKTCGREALRAAAALDFGFS